MVIDHYDPATENQLPLPFRFFEERVELDDVRMFFTRVHGNPPVTYPTSKESDAEILMTESGLSSKNTQGEAATMDLEDRVDIPLPPTAVLRAVANLEKIRHFPTDWDSYGSPPLSKSLFGNAYTFLCKLDEGTPEPFVVPVSGGGVQFEWQVGDRELEIEFSESTCVECLQVFEDGSMKESSFPPRAIDEGRKLLEWLEAGNQEPRLTA